MAERDPDPRAHRCARRVRCGWNVGHGPRPARIGDRVPGDRQRARHLEEHRLRRHLEPRQHGSERRTPRWRPAENDGDRPDQRRDLRQLTYGANGLYKSIDGAVDWSVVWPPANDAQASLVGGNVVDAQIDAANHEHLLINFDLPCDGSPGQGCFAETLDAGATWKVFEGDAATGPFAAGSHVYFLESTTWLLPSGSTYWRTADSGATWTSVVTGSLTLGGDLAPQSLYRGGDGRYYLGAQLGVLSSTDGTEWSILPGSPQYAAAMPNDSTTLFATTQNSTGVFRSPDDGVRWTPMADSPQGCAFGAYDETDHLLYASCGALGLWRVVTE